MTFSSIFAQFVALLGGIALQWRKLSGTVPAPAWGQTPAIPEAKPQGAIPTLKMPTARGWRDGEKPTVAPGLKVNAFATGLDHPRWIEVLPPKLPNIRKASCERTLSGRPLESRPMLLMQ